MPSPWLLQLITTMILKLWPVTVYWKEKDFPKSSKILYVANHVTLGLDAPSLMSSIYQQTGHLPRGLGDTSHFNIPIHSHFIRYFGVVLGSPENCSKLMKDGQPIIVYPGGGREVMRKTTDKPYTLMWGERMGFARLAIEHGYTIIPVASIGIEDNIQIVYDIPLTPIMRCMKDKRTDMTFPLILPKAIGRLYFSFGENVDTSIYTEESKSSVDANKACQVIVRDKVRYLLETLIADTISARTKHLSTSLFCKLNGDKND